MSFFLKLAHQNPAKGENDPSRSVWFARTKDVNELQKALQGYRVELNQIDRGPFAAEIVQIQLGSVLLSAGHYGRALVQCGDPPEGRTTFAVRTSPTRALWQGRVFGPGELLVGRPGAEIDIVSQPDFGVATASFPLGLVEETLERSGLTVPTCAPTSLLVDMEHGRAQALRTALDNLFSEAGQNPFDQRAAMWALAKQEDLLRVLLQFSFGRRFVIAPASSSERDRVLKAALGAIKDRPGDALTVGDLCRIAKASERTLHYAFTERFGIPPARYMKAHRLNGVRRDLCSTPLKISDAANKWGFWHLGQFAKDYQDMFGELPSSTVAGHHGSSPRQLHST